LPEWVPTPGNLRLRRAVRKLDDIVFRVINRRRGQVARGEPLPNDLLTMLLHAQDEGGSGMTDEQLRDEVMPLCLAGHDTTALTLAWTLYLLAQSPEVDEQLFAELTAVLGGRLPTVADLPRLPYTERVIQESMRMYPPAYAIGREALHD